MRLLLQRVTRGSVQVSGKVTGAIDTGLVMLVGISGDDHEEVVDKMARKVANLRIFTNPEGKFDQSLLDVKGGALVVSQFTLYADTRKGRRPSFTTAARPQLAEPLVQRFAQQLEKEGVPKVEHGVFGAHMEVSLCNSGPVTIWIDSDQT